MKTIPLFNSHKVALVDDEDYDTLIVHRWRLKKNKSGSEYAVTGNTRNGGESFMHYFLVATDDGLETDHVDGNGLNNQRSNLRRVTRSQNCMNKRVAKNSKSGIKGVRFHVSGKWQARIEGRSLGLFDSKEEASISYNKAATESSPYFRTNP